MTITTLALHKAIMSAWDNSSLDYEFKNYWATADKTKYLAINENSALPRTPMPYCIYTDQTPSVSSRMSHRVGDTQKRSEFHDHMWEFNIYANDKGGQSAKMIAGDLASKILAVFGGHPTEVPDDLTLDTGAVVNVQYDTDYGERLDDETHKWTIRYMIKTDNPMAA